MTEKKRKYTIKALHGQSGKWIELGQTEIELTTDEARILVHNMMRDANRSSCSAFLNVAYSPGAFDAFCAEFQGQKI